MTDKANALSQLADKLSYRVENPSAWPEGFDQGGSDLFREAATTIRAFATASNPLQAVVDRFPGGEAAFNAVLQCPHEIDAEKVVLKIDHSRPGNAIAQLHARLSALKTTPAPVSEQEAIDENELEALADGAWGNGPASKGAARDALTKLAAPAPVSEHPDDLAVDKFAAAMKAKLAIKRGEGRGGWENKNDCSAEFLSNLVRGHIEKGDPLDVGNLAMMLHQRGDAITPAPVSEATHRHKKRGTEYVLIGEGKMQAETWVDMFEGGVLSVDDEEVAIYRSATDPTEIWVRPLEEFRDGRFENLTTSTGGELNG